MTAYLATDNEVSCKVIRILKKYPLDYWKFQDDHFTLTTEDFVTVELFEDGLKLGNRYFYFLSKGIFDEVYDLYYKLFELKDSLK
jgi:hypothetical protein